MLKRFYSKRSGFTLVEIIVAFAVFAIMASMIAQILDLALKARLANNDYALELARQQKILTVVEKDKDYYNDSDKTGDYKLSFLDGTTIDLGYQVKAADPTSANQWEGLNYFLSNVDYTCAPGADPGIPDADLGGMTQASRMDTRITGTVGIGGIAIHEVYKDEFTYPDDSPFKLPAGHTRYWFEVAASSVNADGDTTLREEDVRYAQYRLYFFSA
ncbi:MAG: type II secretion system protein J, partial [Oscillospiraceae bacterium]